MAGQRSPNLKEISEMQNEGGSDVFTSTRHINNTQNVRQIFLYFRDITNLDIFPVYYSPLHSQHSHKSELSA